MTWRKLGKTYQRHGIFLALGAGVSVDSSIPTWVELLRRLCEDLASANAQSEELRSASFTLPAIAGILNRSCATQDNFAEHVRKALYRDFPFFPGGVGKHNHSQLIKHVREKNPTLRAVASLCACSEPGGRVYSANPHIHAIVSFNLDALLQGYIYT